MDYINELKIRAGEKVTEMDNISTQSKKQLLRYVKEADEYQVKKFLLDEEIGPIEEDEKSIIDGRIERSPVLNENAIIQEIMGADKIMGFAKNVKKNGISYVFDVIKKSATAGAAGTVASYFTLSAINALQRAKQWRGMQLLFGEGEDPSTMDFLGKFLNILKDNLKDLSNQPDIGVSSALIGLAAFGFSIVYFAKVTSGKDDKKAKSEVDKEVNKQAKSLDDDKSKNAVKKGHEVFEKTYKKAK